MKLRSVLNGLAALSALGVFYTFAFCMVDNVDETEISGAYYYNTAQTEATDVLFTGQEFVTSLNDVTNAPAFIKESPELPSEEDNERIREEFESVPVYEAAPVTREALVTATPIYTEAVTTAVPRMSEEEITQSAGAQTSPETLRTEPEPQTEPVRTEVLTYDTTGTEFLQDDGGDAIHSENMMVSADIDPSVAFADENENQGDLLSELDRQPDENEIMQNLSEMQQMYDNSTETSPLPGEDDFIYSSSTYFETVPYFPETWTETQTEPVWTDITSASPTGQEMLTVKTEGSTREFDAYELVCMIVSREMSPSFNKEALKAQAVAAYSYVKYHNVNGLVPSVLIKRDIPDEVTAAVNEVFGKCCYYNGEVAQTVYTASSAGTTASAQNVWGGKNVPYLISIDTSFDAVSDPNYGVTTSFSENYMRNALENSLGISLSNNPSNWITVTSRIDGNYVGCVDIDGQVTVSGRKIREQILDFGIKSACFDVSFSDGEFTFTTYGYGHGVGMSQNGANILAKQGYSYDQILAFYFPGITIS